jgi:protein-S-isoprenylcysteine O-methyltransferase Ste14
MDHSGKRLPDDLDDARPFRLAPRLVQILSATTGSTALIAFSVFLFTGPWHILVLYKETSAVLAFDLCLSMAFFAQHSGMIRNAFKAWFARFAPAHYHGAIFSIASGICLFCVVHLWQASEHMLVTVNAPWRLGLQAIRYHLRGKSQPAASFSERGPYRWVRHPQYFCVLVMIWSFPDLTADRLLFNVLWSTWIAAGTLLEERDLLATLGDQYRDYQARVPMLIPLPGKAGSG